MKRILAYIPALLVIAVSAFSVNAQTSFKPEVLGNQINSDFAEINPILHPDGKTLYFSRVNHPENRFGAVNSQDIWYSSLSDDGTWSEAKRLPNSINIGRYNAILGILEDGKTFLINGIYSDDGKYWLKRGLSFIERTDNDNWGKPQKIDIPGLSRMNKGKTTTAYITPDGKYIFFSFSKRANGSNHQIYLSVKEEKNRYSRPKRIEIGNNNLGDSYESPFLSKDSNALYFSCNVNGNHDLYMANRTDDTFLDWSEPTPLQAINSEGWDNYYHLNAKESWAYYCSSNSNEKSRIMRVKIYEEFPFVKLTGLVMNRAEESLMLADTNYQIKVNDSIPEKIKVDKASASYELLLPLGKKYTLIPELANWIGVPDTLDFTDIKEYTEMARNIYVEPIPIVKIAGKVINTRTNLPISPEMKYRILVNGAPSDSVKYETEVARYSMNLPLGNRYVVSLELPNFTSKPDTIDVTSIKFYTEKPVDFYATSVPWVEVNGVALDNVTFTPIIGASSPKLMINGSVADSITIDPVSGEFKLRLPFGQKFTTAIASKGYNSLENKLDLTGYVEFTQVKHEVFAERKDANMAVLSGKIINLKTGQPVEREIPVKLKVNGVETKGFQYDSTTANYTLKLPVGVSYDILPSVKNFYNKYEQVDLSKVKKRTKIAKNFYVTPIEVGQTVNIDFIYFDVGKAILKPQSFRSLNALVEFLNEYPNVVVEISGHTDNTGSAALNQRLSDARAKSVADYIIKMGVPKERITSKGYGPSKPKASNKTAAGRAQNRRVEFTIVGV